MQILLFVFQAAQRLNQSQSAERLVKSQRHTRGIFMSALRMKISLLR